MPVDVERLMEDRESSQWRSAVSGFILIQIPMAASAAALLFSTAEFLGRPLDAGWYAAAFLGTWCVYLHDSAASCDTEDRISQPRRAAIFRSSRLLATWFPILSAVLGIGVLLSLEPSRPTITLLFVVAALGLLHAIPFGGSRGNTGSRRDLKRFAVIKSPLVSIAWAVAAVALPILEGDHGTPDSGGIGLLGVWLGGLLLPLLLADSLLLDVRDIKADQAFGLHTIAVRLGAKRARLLSGVLIIVAVGIGLLATARIGTPSEWIPIWVTAGIGLGLGWAFWPRLRHQEATISIAMMGWRFLLPIPALLG